MSFDGKALTYDAVGNPLSYNGYTYTWEMGRQLATINGNGNDISYKYNDKGIRTEKVLNGVATKYHLIGDKVTFEDNGTDKIYYSYDANNKLVSMNLNGVEYFHIRNGQGDIIGLFDSNGSEVVKYTYDTWGKLISIDGTLKDTVGVKNPYRYRGYRYDTETGLYYLNSRYYNPEWGRFINADSTSALKKGFAELLTANLFAYCANDPVNKVDPNGDFFFIPLLIATAPSWVPWVCLGTAAVLSAVLFDAVGLNPFKASNEEVGKVSNLPKNSDELIEDGWTDVTSEGMAENTNSREYYNPNTGMKVRFDPGTEGASGFEGKDHYHIYNPNSTGKGDYYLDGNGNPVPKGSKASHLIP